MSFQIGNVDLGVGFKGDLGDLQAKMGQAAASVEGFGKKSTGAMRDVAQEASKADDSMQRLAQGIKGAFVGGSVAVGLIMLKNQLMGATSAMIDAQVQLDRLRNGFSFGAGGPAAGAREFAFVREEVNRLGLDLSGTATQYMKLVAASRGSSLAGAQTREIFMSIAEASTVMGMGADQSERSMMAVAQMMSKGKIMAEELRGQLGEHLPGAFGIAARAMGVTEAELNNLLETGQVLSTDFLPKFAAQLRQELAGSVEGASQSMQASVNRLSTAWLEFKQDVAQSGVGAALAGGIDLLAKSIGLLAGATASLVAGQLAKWALAGASALREQMAASAAATAAQAAAIAANQAELASKIQMGAATQAAILVSREEMLAKLASANASLVQAQAQISAARAAGVQSAALHYLRQGELAATAAMQARSVAMAELALLGRQQAAVTASVTAATAAQTAAMAGGAGAASLASRALGLLGGPIGGVITLLGLAATAWAVWGQSAAEGEVKATSAVDKSTAEITADLEAQISKLKERNALAAGGLVAMAQAGGDAAQRLGLLQQQINNVQAGSTPDGRGVMIDMAARGALLASLTKQYGELYAVTQRLAAEESKLAAGDALKKQGAALADFTKQYATAQQKANAEVEKWKGLLGDAFTEDMRVKITENFVKPVRDAGGATKGAAEEFAKLRENLLAKDIGVSPDFAKSVDLYADALTQGRISVAEYVDELGILIAQQPIVKQDAKEAAEAQEAANKAYLSAIDAQEKSLLNLEQQIAKERDYIATLGLTETAMTTLEAAKLRDQAITLEGIAIKRLDKDLDYMRYEQTMAEVGLLRELATLKEQGSAKKAFIEEAKAATAEWTKFTDQVNQSLTDSLMRAFESGGNFFKTFWSAIVNTLKTTVLKAFIQPIVGGITGAFGFGGSAAAGQAGGAGSSVFSTASSFKSMYDALNGGVSTAISNGFATLTNNAAGQRMGLSYYDGNMYQSTGMGQTMGQAAGMAGNALAGYGIQKAISGEYKIGNGKVVDAITLAASAYFGPIAGVVAGAVNRAFGMGAKKTTASGIEGTFSSSGADLRGFEDWSQKGGWFRSNKSGTNYSALDAELKAALTSQYELLSNNTSGMAAQLKLSADALQSYSRKIRFSTKGLTEDQAAAKLQAEFALMGDEMATLVLGTEAYTRAGETAGAALTRLATSLTVVNGTLDVLGLTLYDVGLVGADMASDLADKFGGLDKMAQASAEYFKTYYSASEQAQASTTAFTTALGALGLRLPANTADFRDLVSGLDLTSESGRATYAALLQMAPGFAELQTQLQRLADETAAKLIATFTARGKLTPALSDLSAALIKTSTAADEFTGPVSTINTLLGDASSGTLVFGNRIATVTGALTPAQLAVQGLQGQIVNLRNSASGTVVDIDGLSAALANVDTRTFVATVTGVFELIGQRIKDALSSITDERVAVREAAMNIIGSEAMSVAQIRQQIQASRLSMPTGASLTAVEQALANTQAATRTKEAEYAGGLGWVNSATITSAAAQAALRTAQTNLANTPQTRQVYLGRGGFFGTGEKKYATVTNEAYAPAAQVVQNQSAAAARAAQDLASAQAYAAQKAKDLAAAQAAQNAAAKNAIQSQLDYVASLQKYSLDASKAVIQLGRLREETVRYYDTQKQLADSMAGAASSLRGTIAAFRFDQMDPMAQLDSLQERYNVAYSMALSTTGEALAGYGQELNSLINPLLQKAQEAGMSGVDYSNLVSTVLARADATANRLEAFAPQDYQAESLGLLGQIDSTLAALEAGAMTADQLIVSAINAGKDTTRDGLRAVVAALTGKTVPAFALGGYHTGGLRLVGENGPEIEATGPSRIFNAGDTARMLRGSYGSSGNGNEAMLQELRALRFEVAALRQQSRETDVATTVNTGKTARVLDRLYTEGFPMRNADNETLTVTVA